MRTITEGDKPKMASVDVVAIDTQFTTRYFQLKNALTSTISLNW